MRKANRLSPTLIDELNRALEMVKAYGSIELYVQDSKVTQITVRNIKKTQVDLSTRYKSTNGKSVKFTHR